MEEHHLPTTTVSTRGRFLAPVNRTGLAEDVYERLRNAIFSGEVSSGAHLDVRQTARLLGVSIQPVKEALQRLNLEGLVVIRPRVGTFVRTIVPEDVVHILSARLMIESFAVKHMPQLDGALLRAMETAVDQLEMLATQEPFPFLAYNEVDIAFHETLVTLTQNPELVRLYRSLHAHYLTAQGYYQTARDKALANEQDHRVIYDAIRTGNLERAAMTVERHIAAAEAGLLRLMSRTPRVPGTSD